MLNVRVVKLGGNALDRPSWVADCARRLASHQPLVVVHGGGRAVSALSRRLNLPVEQRAGLRVTTPEVAEVVEMVLGGPMNRVIVAALRAAGVDAIGLSGVDGGLLTAVPAPPGDLGHVGEIADVRVALLEQLLAAGLTPVIAPVAPAAGGEGVPFNVNADSAAAAIAAAAHATELLLISDVAGVDAGGVTPATLVVSEIEALIERGTATGGMAAKLRAAARALEGGVGTVRIGDLAMLGNQAAGTRLLTPAPQLA